MDDTEMNKKLEALSEKIEFLGLKIMGIQGLLQELQDSVVHTYSQAEFMESLVDCTSDNLESVVFELSKAGLIDDEEFEDDLNEELDEKLSSVMDNIQDDRSYLEIKAEKFLRENPTDDPDIEGIYEMLQEGLQEMAPLYDYKFNGTEEEIEYYDSLQESADEPILNIQCPHCKKKTHTSLVDFEQNKSYCMRCGQKITKKDDLRKFDRLILASHGAENLDDIVKITKQIKKDDENAKKEKAKRKASKAINFDDYKKKD